MSGDKGEIISLAEKRAEDNDAIVKEAERLLAQAKAGEIKSLAYAAVVEGGNLRTNVVWLAGNYAVPLVAAAAALNARVLNEVTGY
jgi:hypothetical protein